MALKLDMEKAYDRIEWDFIIKCFEELGFHPKWVRWIKECISSFPALYYLMGIRLVSLDQLVVFVKKTRYLPIFSSFLWNF